MAYHARIIPIIVSAVLLLAVACGAAIVSAPEPDRAIATFRDGPVAIEKLTRYYRVTIDLRTASSPLSHYRIGQAYGRCIKRMIPDFERRLATYLSQLIIGIFHAWPPSKKTDLMQKRVLPLRESLQKEYRDQLDGIASVLDTGPRSTLFYTPTELVYLFNLMSDVFRTTQCSAFGVNGPLSSGGTPIAFRTLDWFPGLLNELPPIQAVTTFVYDNNKIVQISALGHMGCVTGINTGNGIMASIMDADVSDRDYPDAPLDGYRSYTFDLRAALESESSMNAIAEAMKRPRYAYSHLVFMADPSDIVILENNIPLLGEPGLADTGFRTVRTASSRLNPDFDWEWPGLIGAVNGFMLYGQYDNMLRGLMNKPNYERWLLMTRLTASYLPTRGHVMDTDAVMGIMTSYWGKHPGSLLDFDGDLYNRDSQQMMLYVPAEKSLMVFFKPVDGSTPDDPRPYFIPIALD